MYRTDFFTLETGQATNVGCVRSVNEDSFLSRPEAGLWVVADGMGGHAAGDFASRTIVQQLYSVGFSSAPDDFQARFMDRLGQANDEIREHAASMGGATIGATIVALLFQGRDYACIWSGDSRIYRLREGLLQQQTRDHTEVQALIDAGSISADEATRWPRRNVITKAIGVSAVPDCDVVGDRALVGDVFLLCSDGLTEHVSDAEIGEAICTMAPQQACDALISTTLERGARDNVTVIVLRCGPPPEPEETGENSVGETLADGSREQLGRPELGMEDEV